MVKYRWKNSINQLEIDGQKRKTMNKMKKDEKGTYSYGRIELL